jgi:hypothetical protein
MQQKTVYQFKFTQARFQTLHRFRNAPKIPPSFGLRWQAKRDTVLGVANRRGLPLAKAPSPLRFAGAVQDALWRATSWTAPTFWRFAREGDDFAMASGVRQS